MGSTTEVDPFSFDIVLNKPEGVKVSSDKLKMKQAFVQAEVNTAPWIHSLDKEEILTFADKVRYPIVAKHRFGSRGTGNYKLDTVEDLTKFLNTKKLESFIFEKFVNFTKEYRLHIYDETGCFYSCRKMKKRDAPENWQRHSDNCVWILEENEQFDKPESWNLIIEHCVKAIKEVGLNIGAFDVMVSKDGRFILVEVNSAPSFGDNPLESVVFSKYKNLLAGL